MSGVRRAHFDRLSANGGVGDGFGADGGVRGPMTLVECSVREQAVQVAPCDVVHGLWLERA